MSIDNREYRDEKHKIEYTSLLDKVTKSIGAFSGFGFDSDSLNLHIDRVRKDIENKIIERPVDENEWVSAIVRDYRKEFDPLMEKLGLTGKRIEWGP